GAFIQLSTKTFKPEIIVSQPLDFAEPYLGIGYAPTHGTLSFGMPLPPPSPIPSVSGSTDASGSEFLALIGLSLKPPGGGIRLVVDGEYSTVGADSLGLKFGFNF